MITPLPLPSKLSILTMAGLTRWMVSAKEGGGVGTGVAAGGNSFRRSWLSLQRRLNPHCDR